MWMPLILSASLIMFVDCTETESAVNRINEESNDIAGHFSAQVVPQAPVQVTEEPTKLNVIALNVDKGKSLKNNENAVGVSKSAGKVEEHSETTVKPLLTVNETLSVIPKKIKDDILQSGALMRGFFVFLGLSMMIILYLFFRSYRLKNGSSSPSIVQKYGIRANRSDLEMQPLPLEEEEDEETVFEVGNGSRVNQ